ncbi:hypothetical protein BH20CHL6_BH20CHL6_01260 [soil metagenome]
MTAILTAEGVKFSYPDGTPALDGVDLLFDAGERVAIVGENGSGKTTLVRHFNGLLRPTVGRVLVEGRDARDRHVAELARRVGLVFQDPDRQIFSGSVRAEASFGARNVGLRGEALERAVLHALEIVGLAAELDTNPYDLGFSRRKLLALASVLAMGTAAVVLDEPTTGQDAPGVRLVQGIVGALAAEGRTVVAISHDMRFVAETFERVVVMHEGRVVLDGSPTDVFAQSAWPILRSTHLEPTFPALVGTRLALGATPTEAVFVDALAALEARLGPDDQRC